MESKDELKAIDIKSRTCYYFNDTVTVSDISFIFNEKSNKNTLFYDVSYKTFMGEKPLGIRFNKIDRFIKVYDRIRYLVIFDYWLYDAIYYRIRYLKTEKSSMTNSINHNTIAINIYNQQESELIYIILYL